MMGPGEKIAIFIYTSSFFFYLYFIHLSFTKISLVFETIARGLARDDIVINKCVRRKCLQMTPLWFVKHGVYNGSAAAGCIPRHSGLCRLLANHTMPSDGRTGAGLSKITASGAEQQLYQHERPAQWTRAEQLFPQQRRTGKRYLQLNKNNIVESFYLNIKYNQWIS